MDIFKLLEEIDDIKYWRAVFEQGVEHRYDKTTETNTFTQLAQIYRAHYNQNFHFRLTDAMQMVKKHFDNSEGLDNLPLSQILSDLDIMKIKKDDALELLNYLVKKIKDIDLEDKNYHVIKEHQCYFKIDDFATMYQFKMENVEAVDEYINFVFQLFSDYGKEILGIKKIQRIVEYKQNEKLLINPSHEYLIVSDKISADKSYIFPDTINKMIPFMNVELKDGALNCHDVISCYGKFYQNKLDLFDSTIKRFKKILLSYKLDNDLPINEGAKEKVLLAKI